MLLHPVSHYQSLSVSIKNVVTQEVVEYQLQLQLHNQTIVVAYLPLFYLGYAHKADVLGVITDFSLIKEFRGCQLVEPALLTFQIEGEQAVFIEGQHYRFVGSHPRVLKEMHNIFCTVNQVQLGK